jgi:hypothetical protein
MRLLCKADSPHWALNRRAAAYAAYPPEGWHVGHANNEFQRMDEEWDAVFLLDCNASPLGYGDVSYARLVASHTWINTPSGSDWRTRGCSDSKCVSKVKQMLGRCGTVAVYNTEQFRVLRDVGIRQRIVLCPYSVDCEIFKQAERTRGAKLRCGWAYAVGGMTSFKGLSPILAPLIAELGNEVEWDVITPDQHSCLNTDQLVEWYQNLDLFLCTSSGEGGPQGPFEAAACGAVVVSTDVGQVSDFQAMRDARLIVPTYANANEARETVRQMAARIRELIRDRATLESTANYITANIRLKYNAEVECPKQLVELFGN